jgi:hypothetical protein
MRITRATILNKLIRRAAADAALPAIAAAVKAAIARANQLAQSIAVHEQHDYKNADYARFKAEYADIGRKAVEGILAAARQAGTSITAPELKDTLVDKYAAEYSAAQAGTDNGAIKVLQHVAEYLGAI